MATSNNGIATEKDIYDASGGLFFESSTNRNKCPTKKNIINEFSSAAEGLFDEGNLKSYQDEQLVRYEDISFKTKPVTVYVENVNAETVDLTIKICANTVMYTNTFSMGFKSNKSAVFYLDITNKDNNLDDEIKIVMKHNTKSDKVVQTTVNAKGQSQNFHKKIKKDEEITINTNIFVKDLFKSTFVQFNFYIKNN